MKPRHPSFQHLLRLGLGIGFVLLLTIVLLAPARSDGGYALKFDGIDDYVIFGDTGDIMGGDGWASEKTVSVWVKPTSLTAPEVAVTDGEFITGNDKPRWFGISRSLWNGQDRIWVWNADGGDIDSIGVEFTVGEWMQIVMVHTGGTLYAYKNGQLVGSTPSGPTYIPSNGTGDGNLYIGGSNGPNPPVFLQGEIDEVRFWTVALDASTIQDWTYQELTNAHPDWANLAAYYKMSDGVGATVSDDSGNSNSGSMMGGMGDGNWVPSGALTQPTPTPTSTPTATATATETPTPTPTATNTPTPTPTATPTAAATSTPTSTSTPTDTPTATATPTATETPTPTSTPTPVPPAVEPIVSISSSGDDIILNWTVDQSNCSYEVHRSTTPYFTAGASTLLAPPLPAGTDTYTDQGVLQITTDNHTYIVRAVNCDDSSIADSNDVAEFDFTLIPGGA